MIELGFIKRFLYALILNDLFKNVKGFTNFLTNFIERRKLTDEKTHNKFFTCH